jgi:3-dehydroquinate dehydratase/shikimate dehydrogenase
MESYPGEPTVADLRDVYHYGAIDRSTRLVGVTGFGPRERATTAALNAAFAHFHLPARCLPLGVGSVPLFRKIMGAVKLAAVVLDGEHLGAGPQLAADLDAVAARTRSADLVLAKGDQWIGHDTQTPTTVAALEAAVRGRHPSAEPLRGRVVMVVGVNGLAETLAREVQQRGAGAIIASHDREAAHRLAQSVGCRYAQFEALYSTAHDVLAVCAEEAERGKAGVHPGYLKAGMAVLDLTGRTELLRAAAERGCATVTPAALWLEQVAVQARLLTGQEAPRERLQAAAPWLFEQE